MRQLKEYLRNVEESMVFVKLQTYLKGQPTDISLLTADEHEGLPMNNLQAERNLSIFDKRASKVAKCRNFRFTGKSIWNDKMV